jgi:hypothetical protein
MLRSDQKLICKSIEFDHRTVIGLCSEWRLSKKLSKEHQARSYTQARKEAAMTVIPDDPGTLRARLERTNQFASLARQAVTQARQAARRAARETAAPYTTDHDRPRADE